MEVLIRYRVGRLIGKNCDEYMIFTKNYGSKFRLTDVDHWALQSRGTRVSYAIELWTLQRLIFWGFKDIEPIGSAYLILTLPSFVSKRFPECLLLVICSIGYSKTLFLAGTAGQHRSYGQINDLPCSSVPLCYRMFWHICRSTFGSLTQTCCR